uniref:Uncharacterized protein n=1 Tax=Arundo donax TaxID=35708 RepID=A0A0A9B1B1_ARUDO
MVMIQPFLFLHAYLLQKKSLLFLKYIYLTNMLVCLDWCWEK